MHKDVQPTVVVEVGVRDVDAAQLIEHTRPLGDVLEPAGARVVVDAQRVAGADARQNDVEATVVVEIVEDHTARACAQREPGLVRDVREARRRARARSRRDQISWRHAIRVLADRHVGDVQQPSQLEVFGSTCECPGEEIDGLCRAGLLLVNSARADGVDAPLGVVVEQAIVEFASPEARDRDRLLQKVEGLVHQRAGSGLRAGDRGGLLELVHGPDHFALIGEKLASVL